MYRVFENLDELQQTVQQAYGVPMTANCMVPRNEFLALRDDLRDALPVVRAVTVEGIAAAAGLSVPESLTGLGRLERMGVARNERGMWRLA